VGLTRKLRDRTEQFIQRQPKVSGSGFCLSGRSLDTHLDREADRKEFSDEFISIEHLLLAYAKDDRFGKSQEFGLDEAKGYD